MAHFARLEKNKLGELVVKDCIVVSNKIIENKKAWWDPAGLFTERGENEAVGIAFCQNHWESSAGGFPGSIWKQYSYNSKFRGNPADNGMVYMTGVRTLGVASTDVFMHPEPYPSWHIGINTARWYPPDDAGNSPEPFMSRFEISMHMEYNWDEDKYQTNPANPRSCWVLMGKKDAAKYHEEYWRKFNALRE